MTRLVIALRGVKVAIETDDETEQAPPSYDLDATAEELSAIHPKLAKCAPAQVERRRVAK